MVKLTEIAKELGVSKATVSLAVNGKPGVSEAMRQRILARIAEKEQEDLVAIKSTVLKLIKIIIINRGSFTNENGEKLLQVLHMFETEARKHNLACSICYSDLSPESQAEILADCRSENVVGVILFGTYATVEDKAFYDAIEKPMVFYDYEDPDRSHSSVTIDHYLALRYPVMYLRGRGIQDIRYFKVPTELYNFEKRREAYELLMRGGDIVDLGGSVAEIVENTERYFRDQENRPGAVIFECGLVSVGVLTALGRMSPEIWRDIPMIGIDEIPSYLVPEGLQYGSVRIPHTERAQVVMQMLILEIMNKSEHKLRVQMAPEFISPASVKK